MPRRVLRPCTRTYKCCKQTNCNCKLDCSLGSGQALQLRGMRDCLRYVGVVGWPDAQGRLGGALAQAGGKPA